MDVVDPIEFHNLVSQIRDEKTGVPMKSSLLGFRKFARCFHSKDMLTWVSKNIDYFRDAPNEEITFFLQMLIDRKYVFNSQDVANEEFVDSTKYLYRFREVFLQTSMGRGFKHYFLYADIEIPKIMKSVMTIVKKNPASRIIQNERDVNAFCAFLNNVKHPCLMEVDHCEYDAENHQAFVYKKFTPAGSLRDLIFKATPNVEFQIKYANAKGLTIHEISLYGRQILKGISALLSCGMPFPHLHTGNVLIDGKKFECRFTDLENVFLGRPVQHLPEFDPNLSVELQCFAHILYEMTTGKRIDNNQIPTDVKIDPSILEIITKIFKGSLNIDALLQDPFFYKKGDMDVKPIYVKDTAMLHLMEKAAMEIRGEPIPDETLIEERLTFSDSFKTMDNDISPRDDDPTHSHSKSLELKHGYISIPKTPRDDEVSLHSSPQRSPMPLKDVKTATDQKAEKLQKIKNKPKKEEVIDVEEF